LTEWWRHAYEERVVERTRLAKFIKITIYGSWQPSDQKQILLNLVNYLRKKGFSDIDIVEGEKRPNPGGLNRFDVSTFYLESSHVIFLVFTLEGARLGVTTELDYILLSPIMVEKWRFCVVFNQTKRTKQSLGPLQQDKLADLGEIPVVPFESWEELNESAHRWVLIFLKKLGHILPFY